MSDPAVGLYYKSPCYNKRNYEYHNLLQICLISDRFRHTLLKNE